MLTNTIFIAITGLILVYIAAIALLYVPASERKGGLGAQQLMVSRSACSLVILAVLVGGDVWLGQKGVVTGLLLGLTTYFMFQAIAAFGRPALTLSMLVLSPVLLLGYTFISGGSISPYAFLALLLALPGLILLLEPWKWQKERESRSLVGLLYGIGAAIVYATFLVVAHNEQLSGMHQYLQSAFWQAVGCLFFGLIGSIGTFRAAAAILKQKKELFRELILFSVANGIFFFLGNSMVLSVLKPVEASLFLLLESLMVALFGLFVYRQRLQWYQWAGMILAILGAWLIGR